MIFLFSLSVTGLLIVVSASNWWVAWLGMEIFTLFFIPFLKLSSWKGLLSGLWHYFIIQSLSSLMLLIIMVGVPSPCMLVFQSVSDSLLGCLLLIPILMKLGLPPFHAWILSISTGVGWMTFFLVNSLSKLGPLIILSNLVTTGQVNSSVLMVVSVMIMLSACWGFNESMFRQMIIYSGIISSGWVIISMTVSKTLWALMIASYLLSLLTVTMKLSREGVESLEQFVLSWAKGGQVLKWSDTVNLLNISGMPPSPMFFMKLYVIWASSYINYMGPLVGLVLAALYLKVYYSIFTFSFVVLQPLVTQSGVGSGGLWSWSSLFHLIMQMVIIAILSVKLV